MALSALTLSIWKGRSEKNLLLWGLLDTKLSHDCTLPLALALAPERSANSGELYTTSGASPSVAVAPDRAMEWYALPALRTYNIWI